MTFVPNKAATFIEAILLLAAFDGDPDLIERYAAPAGDQILAMQLPDRGDLLDGAIAQNRFGGDVVEAYFPLYVARCVAPLLSLGEATGDERYRDAAIAATRFLVRVQEPDGGFPQVLYGNGRVNRRPRWVAGAGDALRALLSARHDGYEEHIERLVDWLLSGVRHDGRIITARGFGRIVPLVSRRQQWLDDLGVAGWCDKAFRALGLIVECEQRSTRSENGRRCETILA